MQDLNVNFGDCSNQINYLRPKVADKKIREAYQNKQILYVYGCSGCGKTALVADYLKNRVHAYFSIESISRDGVSTVADIDKKIVVFDDLHLLEDEEFDRNVKVAIKALLKRRDIWVVLISRSDVPAWLMTDYFQRIFMKIEEKDLYLTIAEQKRYFEQWNLVMSEDELKIIQKFGRGFGLIMRMIAMKKAEGTDINAYSIEFVRKQFWAFLEHHVYEEWDPVIQDVLMQLSIIEEFSVPLAEMITGRNDIEKILVRAYELGNFLVVKKMGNTHDIFSLREPMRLSMKRRMARLYSKEKIGKLYYNTGLYYEMNGATPQALDMYENSNDKERISNLLMKNARQNPGSGYLYEMRRYYLELPKEEIQNNIELMAGMSMLKSIMLNIEESEYWYKEIEQYKDSQSGGSKRQAKSWLMYLNIALPHRGIVNMVSLMKSAGNLLMNREISLPEFSVTGNLPSQMNGGKDFCEWSKQDRKLAKSIGRMVEIILGKNGKAVISLALAESFFEKGDNLYEVSALLNKGKMQAEIAGKLEQGFVAVGLQSWVYLFSGHIDLASSTLAGFMTRVEELKKDKLYDNVRAMQIRIGLYLGEYTSAVEWLEQTPDEEKEFCSLERYVYMTKIRVYMLLNYNNKAYALINQMIYYAEVMRRPYIEIEAYVLLAIVEYRLGVKEWDTTFCKALDKAQEYHFVRIIAREGAAIWRILKETKWIPEDKEFFGQVLQESGKLAVAFPGYLKAREDEIHFSDNALKILRLQAEGFTTGRIAEILGINLETVKYHNKQTYKKLGVNSKVAAVNEARKRKLI